MKKKNKFLTFFLLLILCVCTIKCVFAADDDDDSDGDIPHPSGRLSKDVINDMLLQSVSLMGVPYRWGGNTPQSGMDCSGFIRYVFKKSLGITLPRTAAEMAKLGKKVDVDDLEPGDLLFFNIHHMNSHVGMYIGDNKFIQSPHTGDKIKISEFDSYWRTHLNGAKRIVAEDKDADGNVTVEDYQYVDDEALPSGGRGHGRHYRGHKKHHGKNGAKSSHGHRSSTTKSTRGKLHASSKHARKTNKSVKHRHHHVEDN